MKTIAFPHPSRRNLRFGRSALAIGLLVLVLALRAQAQAKPATLRTVPQVDLKRYMGDWRVIAEIPYFAEKGCVDSVESYALRPDGTIDNWFTYRKKSFSAPQKKITAHAFVVNKKTNAEWRVKFAGGLISAAYVVIDLDPEYQWTVVGHPSRNYGWIMARKKSLSGDVYQGILRRLRANGYETSRFQPVAQTSAQLH